MKKGVLIIVIIAGFFVSTCNAKDNNVQKKGTIYRYTESLLRHYNANVVVYSLLFSGDYFFIFTDDIPIYDVYDYVNIVEKDLIFHQVDSFLNSLPHDVRTEKLSKIHSWCDCYYILHSQFFENAMEYFFDIILEIESANKILVEYLSLEENKERDADSFSSSEDNYLFFETITYISTLTPEKRLSFYQEYFEKLKKINQK